MGQSRPLFVYFRPFLITTSKIQIERSLDGVLGIWTHGCRMVSADEPRSYGGRPMKTIVISAFKYITYEWSLFLFALQERDPAHDRSQQEDQEEASKAAARKQEVRRYLHGRGEGLRPDVGVLPEWGRRDQPTSSRYQYWHSGEQ